MKQEKQRKKVKVVLRSGSMTLKIAASLLIVFSMAALLALSWVHQGIREQIEKLRRDAAVVEYENERLEQKQAELDSVQGVEDIARENLGLVDPDLVLIEPGQNP